MIRSAAPSRTSQLKRRVPRAVFCSKYLVAYRCPSISTSVALISFRNIVPPYLSLERPVSRRLTCDERYWPRPRSRKFQNERRAFSNLTCDRNLSAELLHYFL